MADSTGLDLQNLRRIHLIAELTQGQCTLMLASGKATAAGKTLFMRGFDWNAGCPCRSWPAIIVYHPGTGGAGHAFLNIGEDRSILYINMYAAVGAHVNIVSRYLYPLVLAVASFCVRRLDGVAGRVYSVRVEAHCDGDDWNRVP